MIEDRSPGRVVPWRGTAIVVHDPDAAPGEIAAGIAG